MISDEELKNIQQFCFLPPFRLRQWPEEMAIIYLNKLLNEINEMKENK